MVIRVQMNDENVEIIEVQMDDVEEVPAGQAEVVAPDHYEVVELEIKTVPVPRDTGTLHLEPSEQDMVAAARRMTNDALARMYAVSPMDQHPFHLRLLLLHRRGPQSFRDIRTVDGIVHETYGAAAIALGLIEDDRAWHACMEESAALDTPRQLRYLFVTILVHCHPAESLRLYTSNEDNMMEDYNRRLQDVDRARAAILNAIGDLFFCNYIIFIHYIHSYKTYFILNQYYIQQHRNNIIFKYLYITFYKTEYFFICLND